MIANKLKSGFLKAIPPADLNTLPQEIRREIYKRNIGFNTGLTEEEKKNIIMSELSEEQQNIVNNKKLTLEQLKTQLKHNRDPLLPIFSEVQQSSIEEQRRKAIIKKASSKELSHKRRLNEIIITLHNRK